MKILMTNNTLSWRGGTELYIRDLASALRHRGHSVIAYSTELGPIADEMRQAGIAVVDDLGSITETPDVIHAHHHLDAAAAAMRFPAAPVVNACHGWSPWQEAPLPRPLATRYVAVSQMTRERLVTSGVPTDRIAIIPNFVDTARFDKVRPAGAPIRRALAYGNPWRPGDRALAVLRERCVARGLEFEAIGGGMGNGTDCPERLLPEFDLVFAMGRSALEAMACGCAVVVADPQGIGGLVTPANVQAMADANFGLALVVGNPVTAQAVGALIDAAGAHDAAAVTRLVRQQMDIGRAVALWEAQYKLALEDAARSKDDLIAGIQTYLIQQKGRNYSFEHRARVAEAQAETVSAEAASAAQENEVKLAAIQEQLAQARRDLDAVNASAALIEASQLEKFNATLEQAQQQVASLEQRLMSIYAKPWQPWDPYLKRLIARVVARATRRKWPALSARFVAAAERRHPARLVNGATTTVQTRPTDPYGIATQLIIDRYLTSGHITRKPLHLQLGSGALVRQVLEAAPADSAGPVDAPVGFSIVTPYYAHRDYFALCAESVAALAVQSRQPFEWIIFNDDPSMPDTTLRDLMPEAARTRARIISDGANHGIVYAQQTGVEAANYPWILFLDCDDQLEPEALDTVARHIAQHPGCRYFTSLMTDIDETGTTLRQRRADGALTDLFEAGMIAGHLVCFRKDLFADVGGLDPRFSGVQDYDFALRVAAKEKLRRIPSYLYRYRWHGSSQSVGKSARQDKLGDEVRVNFLRNQLNVGEVQPICRHMLPDHPRTLCVIRTQGQRIELLEAAIASVLDQTQPFTPCVVVHGSSDIFDFVRTALQPRFDADAYQAIVFLHAPDVAKKRGYACNVAFDYLQANIADYPLLCFVDDDDHLLPSYAERLIPLMRATRADFVYGSSNALPQNGAPFTQHSVLPFVALLGGPFITFNSFLVRSEAIVAAQARFDETIHYIEDYDFLAQLLAAGVKAAATFDTVSEYRLIGDGNSGAPNDPKHYRECLRKVQTRLVQAAARLPDGYFMGDVLDYPSHLREPLGPSELAHLRAAYTVYASRGTRA